MRLIGWVAGSEEGEGGGFGWLTNTCFVSRIPEIDPELMSDNDYKAMPSKFLYHTFNVFEVINQG